jgi:hypothetical protein
MEEIFAAVDCDSLFYGVARRAAVPRPLAEFSIARDKERFGRLVNRISAIRDVAHLEYAFSELEICAACNNRGRIVWMDLAKNRVDLRFSPGSCGRRCFMALSVRDGIGLDVRFFTGLAPWILGRDGFFSQYLG